MFKKKPILQYESSLVEYQNSIIPAKKIIPEWYKKIPKWQNGFFSNNNLSNAKSVKQCMPFFDSLTVGYMVTLPNDIYIKNNDGFPLLIWTDSIGGRTPKARDEVASPNVVPAGHYEKEFVWDFHASFKIPKGYSLILTHPFNRYDLPFTTLTGIIDGDFVSEPHGSVPFYVKKDFEGMIPQGTPIAQLIPFRQESWQSEKTPGLSKQGEINGKKSFLVFNGFYKKTFWQKKEYN